jgi:hypothetical protein
MTDTMIRLPVLLTHDDCISIAAALDFTEKALRDIDLPIDGLDGLAELYERIITAAQEFPDD